MILRFSDGTTFLVGLVLVFVTEALLFRFRNHVTRPVLTVAAIVGIILVIISATPLTIWAYAVWMITAIAGVVLANWSAYPRWPCWFCGAVLTASTLVLCSLEAPFRRRPTVRVPPETSIYVLGDSISAGMGTKHRCWPEVLDEMTSLRVVNLAQPGATVKSAAVQAQGISTPRSFVVVGIGGNDLLGGENAAAFHNTLDGLVSSLVANQHQVLILELPLFPFQNAFGRAQRQVATKHGAALLPKRYFARVLGTENGTLDGLHLSQAGHNAMARIIAEVIEEE